MALLPPASGHSSPIHHRFITDSDGDDIWKSGTDEFSSVAAYERIDRAVLQRRLLLALFALGTNMGIRAIVATASTARRKPPCGDVRRHFITVDNLRAAVTKLVNATFAA